MRASTPLFGLILLLAGSLPTAMAIPPPEETLPADTLGFVTVPNFSKAESLFRQSSYGRLWQDPAMEDFTQHLRTRLQESLLGPLEAAWDITPEEYFKLLQGQLTLAVTSNGGSSEGSLKSKAGYLLLIDTEDQQDLLAEKLADFRQQWSDAGKPIRRERIEDVEFFVVPPPAEEDPDAPEGNGDQRELYLGQSDSLFLFGNSPQFLETLLISLNGGRVPTLSEEPAYQKVHVRLFRDTPAYGWIHFSPVQEQLQAAARQRGSSGSNGPNPFPIENLLKASGLNGLESLAFTTELSSDGTGARFFVGVPQGQRRGLFEVLSPESKDAGPPGFVPADALTFSRWRIDWQKTWTTVENMLKSISPQMAGVVQFMLQSIGKDQDPQFSVRDDLIGNLGDDLISYEKPPRDPSADPSANRSLTLIGSSNPDQLLNAFRLSVGILPTETGDVTERDFLGRTIYSVPLRKPSIQSDQPKRTTLHFAADASYVALSTDAATLEEYLRNSGAPGETLLELPGLRAAAQKVGGMGNGFFGFENDRENLASHVEMLRKRPEMLDRISENLPNDEEASNDSDTLGIDFTKLPPFDKIAKYFHFSVYGFEARSEGLYLNVFAPQPPELRN